MDTEGTNMKVRTKNIFEKEKRGHTLTMAFRQGSSESSLSLGQVII